MKIIGIIPSRYESSRFSGKPLVELKGKTMIQRVYERAKKARMLDEIFVATDDERIAKHVKTFGNVVMTDSDIKSGTDRCAQVVNQDNLFDIVINIQGDEPLIHPEQIDQLCKLMVHPKVSIGTLIKKIDSLGEISNPDRIKAVINNRDEALYFSRSAIPHLTDKSKLSDYWRHIGMYGFKLNTLQEITELPVSKLEEAEKLEQLRWMENGYTIHTIETELVTPNIDVPKDVDKVLKHL